MAIKPALEVARTALAGGASSPVRAGRAVGGAPFVQSAGRGAYAYDESGRAYVDYVMAYGPLLFGHAHPELSSGLDGVAARGTVFGSTHPGEERLAERIAGLLPAVDSVRFFNTGTEAAMSAVRVARAFTGRTLVLRFAGNYHGHFDAALHGAGASANASANALELSGIPAGVAGEIAIARYNDLADVDRLLAGRQRSLAAILVEPVAANMGLVLPKAGFLEGLFERARAAGGLVIFDEVITWPRVALGGAQGAFGLRPDLTTLGKVLGGGFPLAALGGRADVMDALAPCGAAFAGGTFSGNPFSVAIGHRVLDMLARRPDLIERLDRTGRRLADGLRRALAEIGLGYSVAQLGSMVDLKFRAGAPPANYDEAAEADRAAFAAYYHAMRARGVLAAPSVNELMFVSTEHGDDEIDATIAAARESLAGLPGRGA